MVVAIHQPNFIPWFGYFYKLAHAQQFVLLDTVQYSKNSFINRNRIKSQFGPIWLTVPVCTKGRFDQAISAVEMNWDHNWQQKHLHSLITNYHRAPFFDEVFLLLKSQYVANETVQKLADFNLSMIQTICRYLDIFPTLVRASELDVQGKGTDLLVNICARLGASTYLAGTGAVKYQEDEKFATSGILVQYSSFQPIKYNQLWGEFVENLSVVDVLMNCGQSTRELLGLPR
jgi:hypothetical protein